jgi:hypothetical protein
VGTQPCVASAQNPWDTGNTHKHLEDEDTKSVPIDTLVVSLGLNHLWGH